jgi:hypothetical protein
MSHLDLRLSLVAASAALALATACGGPSQPAATVAGSAAQGAPPASPTTLTSAQRSQDWLSYAACLRAHGANEPDPSFGQDGSPQWAINPKTLPAAALQACQTNLQALSSGKSAPAPGAAQVAQMTRYAQCMRQHGISDFPDPDPQTGQFNLQGTAVGGRKGDAGMQAAQQSCQQLLPAAAGK